MRPSSAGASGSSSRLVRITPRNSQLPCSRLTRLVCLPCQPIPAACASGFSITGAVSTNTFSSDGACVDDEPRQRLQRLLDRLVIVAALRIDRNAAELRMCRRARAGRAPAHSSCPARSPTCASGHSASGLDPLMRARLHPPHRAVMPRLEPPLELEPGGIGGIGARKAARDEPQLAPLPLLLLLQGLGPYARARLTPAELSKVSIS